MLKTELHLLEIEMRVYVRLDTLVGLDDLFQVHVDEVVEGVDMLLNQTLDLQECRQKLPFILQ